MTTIYVPRLIESAEQAEALPDGTLATDPGVYAAEKDGDLWLGHLGPWPSSLMVGRTALVPIEAEEETTRPMHLHKTTVHVAPPSNTVKPSRRLVTPWEAV